MAVHIQHIPHPNATQVDSFFGVNGTVTLFGGSRGQTFEITGVLAAVDVPTLVAAETILLSFADGIARPLIDPIGRIFPNVVFQNQYTPSPDGIKFTDWGVALPYKCVMHGLT